MGEVTKWFTHNLWLSLLGSATLGCIAAAVLTSLLHRFRRSEDQDDETGVKTEQEQHQLLLFCGDAKAVADLAIQRNMVNPEFLRRLEVQPCYAALVPHLGEEFLLHVTLHEKDVRGSALAILFRKEIERLEELWSAKTM